MYVGHGGINYMSGNSMDDKLKKILDAAYYEGCNDPSGEYIFPTTQDERVAQLKQVFSEYALDIIGQMEYEDAHDDPEVVRNRLREEQRLKGRSTREMSKLSKDDIAELWKMNDPSKGVFEVGFKAGEGPTLPKERPHWMLNFSRSWATPASPVLIQFTLKEGYEQEAFDFLYNNNENLDEIKP